MPKTWPTQIEEICKVYGDNGLYLARVCPERCVEILIYAANNQSVQMCKHKTHIQQSFEVWKRYWGGLCAV